MAFFNKIQAKLSVIGFIAVLAFGFYLTKSILFPNHTLQNGIVLDKLYVPSSHASSGNALSFHHYKARDYTVTATAKEQWLALVNTSSGKVMVHCDSLHYKIKEVGDTLHFTKYSGEILGIEYLSYYEEDKDDK
jgi:hypothetical protein